MLDLAERFPAVTFKLGPPTSYVEFVRKGGLVRFVYETLTLAAAPSEDEAWAQYWNELSTYLADRKAKRVLWRVEPTAEHDPDHGWQIRSRLAVVRQHG